MSMPSLSLASLRPLADKFASLPCDQLARASGFVRRVPRKINPAGFLLCACLFALQTTSSLAVFAQLWAMLHQQTLSKQAVHKRCSATAVAFPSSSPRWCRGRLKPALNLFSPFL